MSISGKCVVEIRELQSRAEILAHGDAKSRFEANVLLSRIKTLQTIGLSTDEINEKYMEERTGHSTASRERTERRYSELFTQYIMGKVPAKDFEARCAKEFRTDDKTAGLWGTPTGETYVGGDLQGGTTSGVAGGYSVPVAFHRAAINAVAQFAPLADRNRVTFIDEPTYGFPTKTVVGFDFSSYKAARLDTAQTNNIGIAGTSGATGDTALIVTGTTTSAPPSYSKLFDGSIYAAVLRIAMELEQDAAVGLNGGILAALADGFGESFGRTLAEDLILGSGTNQPQGIVNGAKDAGITNTGGSNGELDFAFLRNLYFTLNRRYRASSKCAWVMSDDGYNAVRDLRDSNGRPLIDITADGETLFGKPVLVSPELSSVKSTSPVIGERIIFGDLSHYVVRVSAMYVKRLGERFIDFGEVGLSGRLRADAKVFDPSSGAVPPIIKATVQV